MAGPVLAAAGWSRQPAPRPDPVGIIGAGLAGLRAAAILRAAGQRVVVLEARRVPGGRVRTVRGLFADGLLGEAGPIRIAAVHQRVLHLIRAHDLTLVPFSSTTGSALVSVGGQTVRSPAELRALAGPLSLRSDEIGLSAGSLVDRYVGDVARDLEDPEPTPAMYARWQIYDRLTWPAWLRSRGATAGAIALMTAGGDSSQLSALYVLRQIALFGKSGQFYKIRGGLDLLPASIAESLGASIRYGCAVTRLDLASRGPVRVEYLDRGAPKTLACSRVIVTLPFSTLRRVVVQPRWPAARAAAIATMPYFPAVRFLLQTKSRFWDADGLNGVVRTDQPVEIWDAAYDSASDRGLLGMTAGGAIGDRLTAASAPDALRFGVDLAARPLPAIRSQFQTGTTIRWARDPWARGAFAVFRPGQMTAMMPAIAEPHGRVHFAGEHTSPWTGWMEGALESGERAAAEVLAAEAGAAPRQG